MKTAPVVAQHVRDILQLTHSKNFLKMSNLETSLLLLKIQTFIIVYNVFYARQLYRQVLLRARISYGNSVRLSVRLSVTTRWYTKHR